jgi:hypothetical protein
MILGRSSQASVPVASSLVCDLERFKLHTSRKRRFQLEAVLHLNFDLVLNYSSEKYFSSISCLAHLTISFISLCAQVKIVLQLVALQQGL